MKPKELKDIENEIKKEAAGLVISYPNGQEMIYVISNSKLKRIFNKKRQIK